MALFKTHNGYLLNPDYIILVSPIAYNDTTEKYYYVIHISWDSQYNISFEFDQRIDAEKELYRLMEHMV